MRQKQWIYLPYTFDAGYHFLCSHRFFYFIIGELSNVLLEHSPGTQFMNVSGAEGLVVSGNIFYGNDRVACIDQELSASMNRSEIFLVMVAGMGTIAGSVMATSYRDAF